MSEDDRKPVADQPEDSSRVQLFREAALAANLHTDQPGRPLNTVSGWTRWALNVTVLLVVSSLLFAGFAPVGEFVRGVAVVQLEGRTVTTSSVSGTVQSIEVETGEAVEVGQVLVRLDDEAQRSELDRVERAYEQRLVELLRKPADAARRERVAALESELQRARARLRERTLRASARGHVSDIRVRPGQPVVLGDVIASIESDSAQAVVVGLFPGQFRPLLGIGDARAFLQLQGFPDVRTEVALVSVADEVVGANEALRVLGSDREGALELEGPVVIVEAVLPDRTFVSDDDVYRVYDGMQGELEIELRSATLLENLFPTLRKL